MAANPPGTHPIYVILTDRLHDAAEAAARQRGISMAEAVRRGLQAYLKLYPDVLSKPPRKKNHKQPEAGAQGE